MNFKRIDPREVLFTKVNKVLSDTFTLEAGTVFIQQVIDVTGPVITMTEESEQAANLGEVPLFTEVFSYNVITNELKFGITSKDATLGTSIIVERQSSFLNAPTSKINAFRLDLFMGIVCDEVLYLSEKQDTNGMDIVMAETSNCYHICADGTTSDISESSEFKSYLENSRMEGLTPIWTFPKKVADNMSFYGVTNATFSGMQIHLKEFGFSFLDVEQSADKIPFALHVLARQIKEYELNDNVSTDEVIILTEELESVLEQPMEPFLIDPQNLFQLDLLFNPITSNHVTRSFQKILDSIEKRSTEEDAKREKIENLIKSVIEDVKKSKDE